MTTEYLLERELRLVMMALTEENRLVCEVMLHTGLRVGDVVALPSAVLTASSYTVTESKTGKRRKITLPMSLKLRLKPYVGEKWLFPGRNPLKHRTRQAVYKDIKRAGKAFRLPQNVGAHSMRKVYAVRLFDKYGDIERVRRALNHGSAAVTMLYAMADRALDARRNSRGRRYVNSRGSS